MNSLLAFACVSLGACIGLVVGGLCAAHQIAKAQREAHRWMLLAESYERTIQSYVDAAAERLTVGNHHGRSQT